jgi:hypothetical protein
MSCAGTARQARSRDMTGFKPEGERGLLEAKAAAVGPFEEQAIDEDTDTG